MAIPVPNTNLILKLNNYGYTDESINQVIEYKRTGQYPPDVVSKYRYDTKWRPFEVVNNKLYYSPLNLEVIRPEDKEQKLKDMYDDPKTGLGVGIKQFYYRVCSKYLNIFRRDCGDYIKRQKVYQMTRNTTHQINKPIITSAPNERWAIDLVDMNRYSGLNNQYRYILTCIDYFTGYVWARPLRDKTSVLVARAMSDICRQAGVYPHIVMKDNGGDMNGVVNRFMREHHIEWINTLSYSPQSNGKIENFNNQLRKMLREYMIRTNSQRWFPHLQACCDNKNSQKLSTTKRRPVDIWKNTPYTRMERLNNISVKGRILNRARKLVEQNKTHEFNVGDLVRVKMTQLQSQLRQQVKAGDKKFIVVKYSPEIYRVHAILAPDNAGYEKNRYTLEDLNGEPLLTQLKRNNPNRPRSFKRFFATDFMHVEKDDIETNSVFTMKDANKLNRVDTTHFIPDEQPSRPPVQSTPTPMPTPTIQPLPEKRTRRPNSRYNDYVMLGGKLVSFI